MAERGGHTILYIWATSCHRILIIRNSPPLFFSLHFWPKKDLHFTRGAKKIGIKFDKSFPHFVYRRIYGPHFCPSLTLITPSLLSFFSTNPSFVPHQIKIFQ